MLMGSLVFPSLVVFMLVPIDVYFFGADSVLILMYMYVYLTLAAIYIMSQQKSLHCAIPRHLQLSGNPFP